MGDLTPVMPFHDVKSFPWLAELRAQWKSIRKELKNNLDSKLWTDGAFKAANEAYGKDWKIMGVLTEDKWQDEERFKVTTSTLKKLQGVHLSEAFFAKMPPHSTI